MSAYKVFFETNILFPKGRISGKHGDCQVESELTKEEMMVDEELQQFIGINIQQQFKTGKVFSVKISDVQPLTKSTKSNNHGKK